MAFFATTALLGCAPVQFDSFHSKPAAATSCQGSGCEQVTALDPTPTPPAVLTPYNQANIEFFFSNSQTSVTVTQNAEGGFETTWNTGFDRVMTLFDFWGGDYRCDLSGSPLLIRLGKDTKKPLELTSQAKGIACTTSDSAPKPAM